MTMDATPHANVRVAIAHSTTLNFAMEQAGVPVVTGAEITNLGASSIDGAELVLSIEPELAAPSTHRVGRVRAGETLELSVLDLKLRPGRLRDVREAERAQLHWELRDASGTLARGESPLEVLAYNEWAGLRAPPALLATFVTPNDPGVTTILRGVRDRLRDETGDAAITGYQLRSEARVRAMVRALYATLQSLGITYIGVPASFESCGQKIRVVSAVLAESFANCLDTTVLVAACLEQMGLSPLLVLEEGHAYPGVWLVEDRFPEGVVYDAARLRNATSLGQLAFFDSSAMLDPKNTFEASERIAADQLANDDAFLCAIDVAVARKDRYRPLPLRDKDGAASLVSDGEHAAFARSAIGADADDPRARESAAGQGADRESVAARPIGASIDPAVAARFAKWREKLLDLSLRNKLLNFRTDGKSALPLEVTDIARLEDRVAADETYEIDPRPVDERDLRHGKLLRAHGLEEARQERLSEDLDKGIVHSLLQPEPLFARATHLNRKARVALEEGGANVLYLAVGFLKWFESGSSESARLAPLLLVPVMLERVASTGRVRMKRLPEESLPNWTLVEKMRLDFGVDLSSLGNVEADDSGLDVPAMLRGVREAIQRMDRWEVLEQAHVGLFSFAKYLMWRDLVDNADALLENPFIRRIVMKQAERAGDDDRYVPAEQLDDAIRPHDLPLVVDADSTQATAVVSALRGRSYVLQGPPGTGKSQTITNLIAAAIAQGKSVLFVSEKMAALEVVYRRLQSVGLGDFCLELHSHKAQKREVIRALGQTLERAERVRRPAWDDVSSDLGQLRSRLNDYVRALHATQPLGMSFHQASARLLTLADAPELRIARPDIAQLTAAEFRRALERTSAFAVLAAQVEPVLAHPFRLSGRAGWSAQADREARDALEGVVRAIADLEAARGPVFAQLACDGGASVPSLHELAEVAQAVSAAPLPPAWRNDSEWNALRAAVTKWADESAEQKARQSDLATRWNASLFAADLPGLDTRFARWATAFFLLAFFFLFGARRRLAEHARGPLPPNRQVATDLSRARACTAAEQELSSLGQKVQRALEGCGAIATPDDARSVIARAERVRTAAARASRPGAGAALGALLRYAEGMSEHERRRLSEVATGLADALTRYQTAVARVREALQLRTWPEDGDDAVAQASALAASMRERVADFRAWCLYVQSAREIEAEGLAAVVEAHGGGRIAAKDLARGLERGILEAWAAAVRDGHPVLRDFDGQSQHALVSRFRDVDATHLRTARTHILATLEQRLPPPGADVGAASEPGILKRELAKKTRHMPLRKLLQQIPNLLGRLKPCLLMSPLSIAQYLPARGKKFDLVVFDEASQICTHDAIGAIGRGQQVVVVGDSRQLPPTAFFQRGSGDDASVDENDFVELESILDEAVASGLPEQMLGWHYRSRHETLIEFSNHHYYESKLNVFPAARARVADLGVKFHLVTDGAYELGGSRTNPNEARSLVDHLVQSLRATSPKERSFGIVTFSAAQQELIEDLLDEARSKHPEIEPHFADDHPTFEKVFVKNLENVQGDERDEILFSIAYGPDKHGKMLMNFGPMNRDGGERRLNVAVTRAKKLLRVFSTITADRIDTARTRSTGAKHLKAFLRFAADRDASRIARTDEAGGDFDSDFERAVYDVLRASGLRVDTQIGCGGYRIDLAVVHPEDPSVYAIGIECDGAAYHSGKTARDRDRLRQQVLEGLGWRLHRIWSTDWIDNRAREIERLLDAVATAVREGPRAEGAVAVASGSAAGDAAAIDVAVEDAAATSTETDVVAERGGQIGVVPYRQAPIAVVSEAADALYDVRLTAKLAACVGEVLAIEAPMHMDELVRRVGPAFGVQRVTARARKRVTEVLATLSGYAIDGDYFVWAAANRGSLDVAVRGGGGRDAEMVPLEEIAAAARDVLAGALSLPMADLVRETARVFGIQRIGPKVDARMRAAIALLDARGVGRIDGERVEYRGVGGGWEGVEGEVTFPSGALKIHSPRTRNDRCTSLPTPLSRAHSR
jgi:very-short-patch-repair endonuclease